MRTQGFTLTELLIVAAILVVIGALTMTALRSSSSSMEVADAKSQVQKEVRDVMQALTRELQLASTRADDSLNPVLNAIAVVDNPAAGSPVEVVFQTPRDNSGSQWWPPTRLRYVNEDANGNGLLDDGEDLDGDGLLSRRMLRITDQNQDGTNEEMIFGGANNLSNVQFTLDGRQLTVLITSTKFLGIEKESTVSASVTNRIFLQN